MMTTKILRTVTLLLAMAGGPASANEPVQPERGFDRESKAAVHAGEFMIVAAHPLAAQAGYDVLARGGTAMDAAVATQMVLNLVEPQSSGIGGGAFLVYYDRANDALRTIDGRETAPAGIEPDRFLDAAGDPLPWWERITGGGSVGIPGTLKLLEAGHRQFGREPWADLIAPAITLAREGFAVSPRLAASVAEAADRGLTRFETTRAYFFDDEGHPVAAGERLVNEAFARTLEIIAAEGAASFYSGDIAHALVDTVNASRPGSMSVADLAAYEAVERPAVCAPFRGFRVCGMGPPSSGALTVGQILGLLSRFEPGSGDFDAAAVHRFAEAAKLAYADRAVYMADSDYVDVPSTGLLDPVYLEDRAALIADDRAMTEAEAGRPPRLEGAVEYAPDAGTEQPGTSHVSIVDGDGNVLSLTTTIESGFGSRLMTGGFLLNNELTDFSPVAEVDGRPVANRIEPNKRPRSSMAPTIVFDAAGAPVLAAGSPGGSQIINYVAKTIVAILERGVDPQSAVSAPHFGNRNGDTELEAGTGAESLRAPLEALGHAIRTGDMNSGLHVIAIDRRGGLTGGADPRREGVALGR